MTTPRHLTCALAVCACLSLSVLPNAEPPAGAQASAQSVDAIDVAAGPRPLPIATAAAGHPDPDAPLVDAVVRHLATRSSSLSPGEIVHLARVVVEESARLELDAGLVLAVMEVESRFDPFAVSAAGARGLMQLMPATARSLARQLGIPWDGARTLFDPATNARLGIAYLARLRDRFGPWRTALTAYNRGPSAVGRRLKQGEPLPPHYFRKVLSAWESGDWEPPQSS